MSNSELQFKINDKVSICSEFIKVLPKVGMPTATDSYYTIRPQVICGELIFRSELVNNKEEAEFITLSETLAHSFDDVISDERKRFELCPIFWHEQNHEMDKGVSFGKNVLAILPKYSELFLYIMSFSKDDDNNLIVRTCFESEHEQEIQEFQSLASAVSYLHEKRSIW